MIASLIMATVGRRAEVARFFNSLKAQSRSEFELIVVDQNADDRILDLIQDARRAGIEVRHERVDRIGLSAARNRGLALARGDIVGFPDDDCWYEPDVIERVIGAFSKSPAVEGIVGEWVERGDVVDCESTLSRAEWRRFRGGHASSITLFFQRSVFENIGGFDERLGAGNWYGAAEETDLVLRALDIGLSLRRFPSVRVHHVFPPPLSDVRTACSYARSRGRGTGALYAKHGLSPYVVARGLVAPWGRSLFSSWRLRTLLPALFLSWGRLEGFVQWILHERQRRDHRET